MMKKIKKYKLPIGILCVVLVIFILLQIFSSEHWWFGYTYETDGYTNKSATIVKINYPSEKVVIPSTIFFHKVCFRRICYRIQFVGSRKERNV